MADVVLMDIRMPELDGLAGTRELLTDAAQPFRVIMLTMFDLDEYVYAALRAGASGFLLKDIAPEQLVNAVRTIRTGDALLASRQRGMHGFATVRALRRAGSKASSRVLLLRSLARGVEELPIGDA